MSNLTVITDSVFETQLLAESIGRVLRGGEAIELVGDLGGGKTTFVKGLARGLGIRDVVQSPTFTISRLYKARDDLELHHFDFYRLQEAGVMSAELAESLQQSNAIVVAEWGDIVRGVLPPKRLAINIASLSDVSRRLMFYVPDDYGYIKEVLA